MVKKRLIFTLLYRNGKFNLSRNFTLQGVGDFKWLMENYDFKNIMHYIDELVILNVDREIRTDDFVEKIKDIVKGCFIPIACGGGIKTMKDAYSFLDAGADKVVINSLIHENPNEVKKIIDVFGSQFVVGSIDYKSVDGISFVYTNCGQKNTGLSLENVIKTYQDIGVGEIYLTAMQKDGTGQGYDLDIINNLTNIQVPLIVSGGAGKPIHFKQVFDIDGVDAVSTANLFNFMSGGLIDARAYLLDNGVNLARWKTL